MIFMQGLLPKSVDESARKEFIEGMMVSLRGRDGLLGVAVSDGSIMSPGGPTMFAQAFQANWRSLEDMMAWTALQDTEDDGMGYLSENGAIFVFYEVKEIYPD